VERGETGVQARLPSKVVQQGRREHAAGGLAGQPDLAGLSVEEAGLVPRDIEFDVLLVDTLVPVHPVLIRIVEHRVVPPIEQGMLLGVIDRIPVIAPRILLHKTTRNIVDLSIAMQRIEHDEQSRLMVVQFIEATIQVRLEGKRIL